MVKCHSAKLSFRHTPMLALVLAAALVGCAGQKHVVQRQESTPLPINGMVTCLSGDPLEVEDIAIFSPARGDLSIKEGEYHKIVVVKCRGFVVRVSLREVVVITVKRDRTVTVAQVSGRDVEGEFERPDDEIRGQLKGTTIAVEIPLRHVKRIEIEQPARNNSAAPRSGY